MIKYRVPSRPNYAWIQLTVKENSSAFTDPHIIKDFIITFPYLKNKSDM